VSVAADGAITALVALLKALHVTDADQVFVIDGPPDAETMKLDRIVSVLGAKGTSGPDALDLGTAGEQFVIEVATSVDLAAKGDEGIALARSTAVGLWARQEQAVREHVTGDLGASASGVLGAQPASDWDLGQKASDKGRSAWVRWGVLVTAQRQ